MNINVAILAAGSSSRLGYPKQLAIIDGKPLLAQIIETAQKAVDRTSINVIIGAYEEEIRRKAPADIQLIHNTDWETGMGSSIQRAVQYATDRDFDALLLIPCDLPRLEASDLVKLIEVAKRTSKDIICSRFNQVRGIPVVFKKTFFKELLGINPGLGAKKLLQVNSDHVEEVDIPNAAFDLDTPADLKSLGLVIPSS